jgi:hypothetical protein
MGYWAVGTEYHAYDNLPIYGLALQRFDEMQQIIREAQARKLDRLSFHSDLYALAFIEADSEEMAAQQHWFGADPDYERFGLALASDTEAYGGRMGNLQQMTNRAVDSAVQADSKETGAAFRAIAPKGKPLTATLPKHGSQRPRL